MKARYRGGHHRRGPALIALLLALLLGACGQAAAPSPAAPPSPAAQAATPAPTPALPPPTATPSPSPAPSPTGTPLPRAGVPVRLRIPAIGVDAAIEHVGLAPDGAMDVPRHHANTAWYQPGPRPGAPGNAVVAGHVDSAAAGRAVFWDLRQIEPGDTILVVDDDGVEHAFVVTAKDRYTRADFPLARVFGPAAGARLNLITCDGTFDRQRREYDQNLVVYARYAP